MQSKDLCITDVIHKAFVDVNEKGTEIVATSVVMIDAYQTQRLSPIVRSSF